jgi:outer membrane immunogenic protein
MKFFGAIATIAVITISAQASAQTSASEAEILKRLDALEKRNAKLEQVEKENATLRERVRRLEGAKQNLASTPPPQPQPSPTQPIPSSLVMRAASPTAPVYKSASPVVVPWNWTSLYVGTHIGGSWVSTSVNDPFPTISADGLNQPISFPVPDVRAFSGSGFLGGVQAGWNYQIEHVVVGNEIDFSWTDVHARHTDTSTANTFGGLFHPETVARTWRASTQWIATGTGQIGWAADRLLFYTRGGMAVAGERYSRRDIVTDDFTPLGGGIVLESDRTHSAAATRIGWTAGLGFEWAFWNSLSARLEYDFIDFGTKQLTLTNTVPSAPIPFITSTFDQYVHVVKFGANYRFSGPAN